MDGVRHPHYGRQPYYHPIQTSESPLNFYIPQSTEVLNVEQPRSEQTASVETNSVPAHFFNPNSAVSNLAMQYVTTVAAQGADVVQNNVNVYLSSSSRLKYYFAVNNTYVAKKLGLVLFPFAHTNWGTLFDPSGPVPPGDDLNSPDLYIPLMAFITYILVSGAIMGIQSRFSPEHLGILSSEALGWLVMEVLIFLFCIYILNIQSNVSYLDLIALSGYKFVSMIAVLSAYLFLGRSGYYFSLIYVSLSLAFFLIRTLKLKVLPHAETYPSESNKRRVYFLLSIALIQPVLMWWLTRRMMFHPTVSSGPL